MSVLAFDTSVRVPVGDGARLASTVVRPAGAGAWPAVLMRTPYDRKTYSSETLQVHATALAEEGYAVVLQDVRGRGGSEGGFTPFVHEQQDGLETIEWLVSQSWCDGSVGLAGISYNAFAQTAIAVTNSDEVKCWVPALSASDVRTSWIRRGGVLDLGFHLAWALGSIVPTDHRTHEPEPLLAAYDDPIATARRDPADQPELMASPAGAWFFEWLASADPYPGDPAVPGPSEIASVAIPALVVAGWFDVFASGSLDLLQLLRSGPSGDSHRLTAGPWDHSGLPLGRWAGHRDFGRSAMMDLHTLQLQWFDQHLRSGEEVPSDRVFITGRNEWLSGVWPLGSGVWDLRFGDGLVARGDSGRHEVLVDLDDPTPTPGGAVFPWDPILQPGAFDQSGRRARKDVVSLETKPLESNVLAVGEPTLTIPVEGPGEADAVHVTLVEIHPDGPVWNVSDGIGVVDRDQGICSVAMGPIAHEFSKGSAIGVDIAFAADVRLPPPRPGKRIVDSSSGEGALSLPTAP